MTKEEIIAQLNESIENIQEDENRIKNENANPFFEDTSLTTVTGGPDYSKIDDDNGVPDNSIAYRYDDLGIGGNYLSFDLPLWGIDDYINERNAWQKGLTSIADGLGFFYFKVFFKFNTNFGLLGGLMNFNIQNGENNKTFASTSALRFFKEIQIGAYQNERIKDRIKALRKFANMLSYVNVQCPWMIKKINGLDKTFNLYDTLGEDRSVELTFMPESTDMKILNLLSLYRYICYDDIGQKEILPSNLKKFDMMVVVYHMPLKYFQTAIMTANQKSLRDPLSKVLPNSWMEKANSTLNIIEKSFNFLTSQSKYFKYKQMSPENGDFSNMMSFHMFTFQNCEFDVNSFGKYFQGDINNENPFTFDDITVGIKYDRVYHHTMNEWNQFMFGVDGFYYDGSMYDEHKWSNKQSERLSALLAAKESERYFDKSSAQYKSLIDYAESMITDGLMSMDMDKYYMYLNGNLYGDIGPGSDYDNYKKSFDKGLGELGNLFGEGSENDREKFMYDRVRSDKRGRVSGSFYGDIGPEKEGKSYFYQKIKEIKQGTISGNIYASQEYTKDITGKDVKALSIKEKDSTVLLNSDAKASLNIDPTNTKVKYSDYVKPPRPMTKRITPAEWVAKQTDNPWVNMWNDLKNTFSWSSSGWGGKSNYTR